MSDDERNQNASSTSSAPSPHGFQVALVSKHFGISHKLSK